MVGTSPRRSAEALAEGRCEKWFSQIPKGGERLLRFALKRGLVVGMVFLAAVGSMLPAGSAWGAPGDDLKADGIANAEDLEKRIRMEEKRLADIQKRLKFHKGQVSVTQKKEKMTLSELAKLTDEIGEAQQQINVLELRTRQTKNKLAEVEAELQATEEQIASIRAMLASRLVAMYKYGDAAKIDLLLGARDTQEALLTTFCLNRMTDQDQKVFAAAVQAHRRLEEGRAKLLGHRTQLVTQQSRMKQERQRLGQGIALRNAALEDLRSQKQKHSTMARDLARLEEEIERIIRTLLQERQRMAEKARKDRADRTGDTSLLLSAPSGPLMWPHKGKISSPYGSRIHPIFKTRTRHTGIDIDGNTGDPVKAAADGEVLYAGWLKGYGQIVILDHGGSLSTVYAHMSRINVEEGQRVRKALVLGRVGSRGTSTGSHLHFEVRVNGDSKDPLRYLGR